MATTPVKVENTLQENEGAETDVDDLNVASDEAKNQWKPTTVLAALVSEYLK
jgi:hypothetical protein